MLIAYISQIMLAYATLSCGLAFWKGGEAERFGAGIIAADWLFITVAQLLVRNDHHLSTALVAAPALIADVGLCLGLLWLVFRYGTLWLGAALLIQGAQLAMYGAFLSGEGGRSNQFAMLMNVASFALLDVLVLATLAAWWRRVRERRGSPLTVSAAPA